jgi:glycosyltransferase involved in cell wall biosynthesis
MVLVGYVMLGCGIWVVIFAYLLWTLRQLPQLQQQVATALAPEKYPMLSIIIPACNEAEHIEAALSSLLAQDYPALELIVIDDRSSDATGQIIDRLAAQDRRIQAIHITSLPDAWLGKVHALHQGVQHAHGEWLLFTDADIHFAAGALRRTLTYALHTHADHLALLPRVAVRHFWLSVAVRSFGLLFLFTTRAAQVHRSDNQHYIGVGAFNLVRRSVFERTPGFEWLRLEPADDAALGMMVKQAGGASRFALAEEDLSVSWYASLSAMFKGLEKNLFGPGAHYQWWRVLFQVVGAWALVAAPLVGVIAGLYAGSEVLLASAGVAITTHLVFAVLCAEKKAINVVYLLFFPLGILLVNAMMVRAAYRCLRNKGINWRGTHYSLAQLRAGQRLRF